MINIIKVYLFSLFFILFSMSEEFNLKAAPNSGTLLNFESELSDFKKLPKVIPKSTDLFNGDPVENGEKILVKGYRLIGKKNGIADEELLEVLKEEVDKELTFAEIQLVAKKIQDYFRNKGYFLTQAFIPEQEALKRCVSDFGKKRE